MPPITAKELGEWEAFERVAGPILVAERLEVSLAIIAKLLADVYGKPGIQHKLADFIPEWDRAHQGEGQSPEEMIETFMGNLRRGD